MACIWCAAAYRGPIRPTATFISFRLGCPDGVSVQAAIWARAFEALGFSIRRVAGELGDGPREGDVVLPGLALPGGGPGASGTKSALTAGPVDGTALAAAIEGSAVIVVENLLSLPLNLPASRTLTEVLARTRAGVLLHHHDLAWQRGGHPEITELPPRLPEALHVTINEQSRTELADRGIEAVLVHNGFDLDAPLGDREATRRHLGVSESDLLVLQPTRALARKNIPGALSLCAGLARALSPRRCVRYWLAGPAEDGYAPTIDRLVAEEATVPVLRARPSSMSDAYAACDLVAFPSTDEGFGNPVVESVWARRPLAVGHYPVLSEILSLGFSFLDAGDPEAVAAWISSPCARTLADNLDLAREHYSLPALTRRLRQVMADAGWPPGAPEPRTAMRPPGEPAS